MGSFFEFSSGKEEVALFKFFSCASKIAGAD